jgi:hypothetical protein
VPVANAREPSANTGSFTLLAYTSTQDPLALPEKWNDADPHLIDKGKVEQVRLRSFSTNVHKMEVSVQVLKPHSCIDEQLIAQRFILPQAMVAYRVGE